MYVGIPFRKHFPYTGTINHHLKKMGESGVLGYAYKSLLTSFQKAKEAACSTGEDDDVWKVDFHGASIFFVLLTAGALLSVLFVLLEKCYLSRKIYSVGR